MPSAPPSLDQIMAELTAHVLPSSGTNHPVTNTACEDRLMRAFTANRHVVRRWLADLVDDSGNDLVAYDGVYVRDHQGSRSPRLWFGLSSLEEQPTVPLNRPGQHIIRAGALRRMIGNVVVARAGSSGARLRITEMYVEAQIEMLDALDACRLATTPEELTNDTALATMRVRALTLDQALDWLRIEQSSARED